MLAVPQSFLKIFSISIKKEIKKKNDRKVHNVLAKTDHPLASVS